MATQIAVEQERQHRFVEVLTSMTVPEVVTAFVAAHHDLDQVASELTRRRRISPLVRLIEVWDLSHADVAAMFSVTRQAVAKWVSTSLPPERSAAVADLAAATDLLERHIKPERIPAVVRRPAPALGGQSLLDLASAGRTGAVLAACRHMFSFELANF